MSSGGRAATASACATRPRGEEIGLTGAAAPTPRSSLTGSCAMATVEHREPCDSGGLCTVLGAPGGESPLGDSTRVRLAADALPPQGMYPQLVPTMLQRETGQSVPLPAVSGPVDDWSSVLGVGLQDRLVRDK